MNTRRLGIVVCGLTLAFAAPALAGGPPDNQYEGTFNVLPDSTYVGFDAVKKDGKTKIENVEVASEFFCPSGDGGFAFGEAKGALPVDKHDRFQGTMRVPGFIARGGGPQGGTFEVKGKLGKHGKASGTLGAHLTLSGGGSTSTCYTGRLDWRAKKGAEVGVREP